MQEKTTFSRREFLGKTSIGLAAAGAVPRSFAVSGSPNALAVQGGTPVRSAPFPDLATDHGSRGAEYPEVAA